jgi:hypothetical protein
MSIWYWKKSKDGKKALYSIEFFHPFIVLLFGITVIFFIQNIYSQVLFHLKNINNNSSLTYLLLLAASAILIVAGNKFAKIVHKKILPEEINRKTLTILFIAFGFVLGYYCTNYLCYTPEYIKTFCELKKTNE